MAKSFADAYLDAIGGGSGSSALDRAITRNQNNQGLLGRLGAIPRAGLGILAQVVSPFDYLGGISRSIIMGAANEGLIGKPSAIDINRDGDPSNDYSFATNLRRAVLKNPFDPNQRVAGFGEVPGFLKWDDDDNFATKAAKSVGAFTADVASDPLTYLTGGIGPLAKKAGLKAVGSLTAKEASGLFAKEIAEGAGREAAESVLKQSQRVADRALQEIGDETLTQSQRVSKYVAKLSADDLAREAGEEIGFQATAVFRGPGRKSLKQWFESKADETGIDGFRGLYSKQIDDVRGGFRITSPTGKTWVRLTPGGVSPIEPLRSKLGVSNLGQKLTLGADRALQQGAKQSAAQLAKEAVGTEAFQRVLRKAATQEATITTARVAKAATRQATTKISLQAQELVSNFQSKVKELDDLNPGDGELLRQKTSKYMQEFDLPDAQRSFDDTGLLGDATDLDNLALDYARRMIESDTGTYVAYKSKLGSAFSDVGVRQGPGRFMTKEAQDFNKKIKASTVSRKSTGKFKASENYWLVDPDTGIRRRMTLDEANEAVRQDLLRRGFSEEQIPKQWFETDAPTVYLASMDKIARRVERVSPVKALQDKGLLITAGSVGGIDPKIVDERATAEIRRLADEIDKALLAGNRGEADELLADANELQAMVDDAWTQSGAAQNEAFGEVLRQLANLKGAEARRVAQRIGAQSPQAKAVRAAYTRLKKELDETDEEFASMLFDKTRLGTVEDASGNLVQIQDEFMNLFAEKELAVALTNYLRVNSEMGPLAKQLEAQLSAWRRAATIGRGPAFVLRNLGTWWNTVVAGGSFKDFADGIKYMKAREAAISKYKKALPSATPEQLAGDTSLLDSLMKKEMEGKTLGGMDMFAAHQAMEKQGIFGSSLTDTAIGRDADLRPEEITARGIIGRGRSSVFSRTRKGEVQEIRPERWLQRGSLGELVSNARSLEPGQLRPIARTVDAAVNNPYIYGVSFLSEQSEVWLRASSFATGVRRYGSDELGGELAGLLTKATQFDYRDMSEFERRYLRQIAPFYIWTKNNVPFQLRALLGSPGKVNMVLRGQQQAENLLGSDDETLNTYTPGWIREQLGFASRFAPGEGNLALSLNLPLTDVNRYVVLPDLSNLPDSPGEIPGALVESAGAIIGGTRDDAVGSLNPFAKALMESITGTSTFTQAPFTDQASGPLFSYIPGATWIDPETGQRVGSGFAQTQLKNLIPFLGQAERLLPGQVGREGVENDRLLGNYLSQITSFSPLAVSATLTEKQLTGEASARNRALEDVIKREARKLGITTTELRDLYDQEVNFAKLYNTKASDSTSFARAYLKAQKNRNRALAAALAP